MSDKNNPPAFPVTAGQQVYTHGMTLRDWFAGQALMGICANTYTPWSPDAADIEDGQITKASYDLADAMLAARGQS